jgi:cyclin C
MAANYWDSTQRKYWTFSKKELTETRRALDAEHSQLISQHALPERKTLHLYFFLRKASLHAELMVLSN